jgi:hypothetical protein
MVPSTTKSAPSSTACTALGVSCAEKPMRAPAPSSARLMDGSESRAELHAVRAHGHGDVDAVVDHEARRRCAAPRRQPLAQA